MSDTLQFVAGLGNDLGPEHELFRSTLVCPLQAQLIHRLSQRQTGAQVRSLNGGIRKRGFGVTRKAKRCRRARLM
jgi:hypothetical protein